MVRKTAGKVKAFPAVSCYSWIALFYRRFRDVRVAFFVTTFFFAAAFLVALGFATGLAAALAIGALALPLRDAAISRSLGRLPSMKANT